MSLRVLRIDETPNPHALKIVTDRASAPLFPPPGTTRWFPDLASASHDPIAQTLFSVPGINSVLIGPGWLTICKSEGAAWRTLCRAVERALAEVPAA